MINKVPFTEEKYSSEQIKNFFSTELLKIQGLSILSQDKKRCDLEKNQWKRYIFGITK